MLFFGCAVLVDEWKQYVDAIVMNYYAGCEGGTALANLLSGKANFSGRLPKWDIGVIDLWNNAEMNAVSKEDYDLYMVNGIHPCRAGYRDWWTPVFEAYLTDYLQ